MRSPAPPCERDAAKGDRLAVGMSSHGRVRTIPFGINQGVRGFLPGAPNSGKTVTMTSIALAYIRAGLPVIAIDPKRDGALRKALAPRRGGRGSGSSNGRRKAPGSTTRSAAVSRRRSSTRRWRASSGRSLTICGRRSATSAMRSGRCRRAGNWPPSRPRSRRRSNSSASKLSPARSAANAGDSTVAYLESLSPKAKADLGGVRDRLAVLAESQLGRWLEPNGASGAQEIDLAEAMERGDVVYFNLDADRYQLASTMLGASMIVDLVSLTAELQGGDLRGLVLIDEFSAIESESIARLLSRSRSAGLSVLLATQAMADLDQARADDSDHGLRNQVLSQVDFVIAHRQSEPEAAEFLANYAGTRPEWTITERVEKVGGFAWNQPTKERTRTRGRTFFRHPDVFKRLRPGQAIVIEPAGDREPELVSIWKVGPR